MEDYDRCMGAYLGAAIGDAMGGPVEGKHFDEIRRFFPDGVQTLVPYADSYRPFPLHSGYALHEDAGSITDDTYIRRDLSRYFLENPRPWTARSLAVWLADHADFTQWWPVVVNVLFEIKRGEKDAETSGMTHSQGGGIGWWTPVGIIYAGDPDQAAATARALCRIWKASLEQDFCAAFCAGVATAVTSGKTWEDVLDAMLRFGGPLSARLIDRAANIAAKETGDPWALARHLYDRVLLHEEPTRLSDGPMPPEIPGVKTCVGLYQGGTLFWAEQIPLAVAAMVYGKGTPSSIPICVNLGRDCDTTATTVGGLVGGLSGLRGLPQDWVKTVVKANEADIPLFDLGEKLIRL